MTGPSSPRRMNSRRGMARGIGALIAMLMLVSGIGAWSPASAQAETQIWGYVWANDAAAASYTPDAAYQYASTGAQVTIERDQVGEYIVHVPVAFTPGTIQVSSYGTAAISCVGENYSGDANETKLWVNCWDAAGEDADSQFSLFYASAVAVTPSAYLYAEKADQALNEAYEAAANSSFNATGAANTITRIDVGHYQLTLPGLAADAMGNAQVSPYTFDEATAGNNCTIESWAVAEGGADLGVWVDCFDATGAPADTQFNLVYYTSSGSIDGAMGASYWTDVMANGSERQFSSYGGEITVSTVSTGVYRLQIPGVDTAHYGNVQATSITTGANIRCTVSDMGFDQGAAIVGVRCVDATGAATDSDYTVSWVRGV